MKIQTTINNLFVFFLHRKTIAPPSTTLESPESSEFRPATAANRQPKPPNSQPCCAQPPPLLNPASLFSRRFTHRHTNRHLSSPEPPKNRQLLRSPISSVAPPSFPSVLFLKLSGVVDLRGRRKSEYSATAGGGRRVATEKERELRG
ncbi:hypothetical protein BVRB_4g084620 [Beta vulgaris subsp. vulgaris]|nr:hypothetical protein BVRB_4g084620 [Beta vulgaris subsp. vulgaris]